MIARAPALAAGLLAALTLTACESTQSRSQRLRAAAKQRAPERGLRIDRPNPDVKITDTAVLTDARAGRSAAVVTLRNTSARPLAGLPLLFTVTGADGAKLFSNDRPGASADLTTVGSLPAREALTWVDDVIVGVRGARAVQARVGEGRAAATAAGSAPPRMRLADVRIERDRDGATAVGRVFNPSPIPQRRLVIFATARRGGRVVAAGRGIVPLVRPGPKGARFRLFFVGDPSRGRLRLQAPAVSLGAAP